MRLIVDLKSHLSGSPQIVQVDKTPDLGSAGQIPVNGRYLIPVTPGSDFEITAASKVLDGGGHIDGADVSSEHFGRLLARYAMFNNVYFNPLLTADHVAELDLTATFLDKTLTPPVLMPTRAQTGREVGALTSGQMPNNTAILAQNDTVAPARPGVLITDEIDISSYTLDAAGDPAGADQFLIYWKLYDFEVTDDVISDHGATSGLNTPALRYLREMDQEPSGFEVYLTVNAGAAWCRVNLLEPIAFCQKSTAFRLAFVNRGAVKIYLATYAAMF